MRLLLSCVGRRGYLADYFRAHLGPHGCVIGTSNSPWTAGFAACDRAFVLPDVQSPEYVPTVLDLCREEGIEVVLSLFDLDVQVLSVQRDALRAVGALPILPSERASQIAFDKLKTADFLTRSGLGTPETHADLHAAGEALARGELKFPVVVKPRFGFASEHVRVARNPDELAVFFGQSAEMVVQRGLAGEEYHLDVLNDLDGRVVAVIPKRKLAMRAGETDRAVTVERPDLLALGQHLGEAFGAVGHVGPLDVDVFVEDDALQVLELNPRFGGGYPCAHLAGADFPGLVVAMARGEAVPARIGDYMRDVVMMKGHAIAGGPGAEQRQSIVDRRGAA